METDDDEGKVVVAEKQKRKDLEKIKCKMGKKSESSPVQINESELEGTEEERGDEKLTGLA